MATFRTANRQTNGQVTGVAAAAAPPAPVHDGPTQRIDSHPHRGRVVLALILAGLALNLAALAALVAWKALNVARASATPPATAPASEPAARRAADFHVAYAQEPLRVQVGCSAVTYLDLDEPRTGAASQAADLRYDSGCGKDAPRLTLGPGAAGGAQIQSSDTDAAGCDRAIRTSPLGPGASVEVRKGVVLCVLTAGRPAELALVEITDAGRTGTAALRATSWKVTG